MRSPITRLTAIAMGVYRRTGIHARPTRVRLHVYELTCRGDGTRQPHSGPVLRRKGQTGGGTPPRGYRILTGFACTQPAEKDIIGTGIPTVAENCR